MDPKTRDEFWGELNQWWEAKRTEMREQVKEDMLALVRETFSGEGNPFNEQITVIKRQAEALEKISLALQEFVNLQKGK